jgi:magnesium-transporting ATPase (P-type)
MAGCHSLVQYDDEIVGDPLETAALKAVRWQFDHNTSTSFPRPKTKPQVRAATQRDLASNSINGNCPLSLFFPFPFCFLSFSFFPPPLPLLKDTAASAAPAAAPAPASAPAAIAAPAATSKKDEYQPPYLSSAPKVRIVVRHHFASKLQRMSVIAQVEKQGAAPQYMVLTKGLRLIPFFSLRLESSLFFS